MIPNPRLPNGWFSSVVLFLFLSTQDVSGVAGLRDIASASLLVVALIEFVKGREAYWGKVVLNPIFLSSAIFVLSAGFACLNSPMPNISFGEMQAPLLKGMIVIPLIVSIVVLGLVRSGWKTEQIALLFIMALAVSGLGQLVWIIWIYLHHFIETGAFPEDPFFHRYKVGAVMIAFPFVLVAIRNPNRKLRAAMGVIAIGLLIAAITSNSRGAWLGIFASVAYLVLANRVYWKHIIHSGKVPMLSSFVAILTLLVVVSGTPLGEMLSKKIDQGFDTSQRFGNGVWGASLDMIKAKPWLGYGYGDAVYSTAYNALAPSHPEWIVRRSIGPHNGLLAHWVAAGLGGLIAMIGLYAGFLFGARKLVRNCSGKVPAVDDLVNASVAAMISYYLVRGQVEIVRWDAFGILVASMLWLFVLYQPYESGNTKV